MCTHLKSKGAASLQEQGSLLLLLLRRVGGVDGAVRERTEQGHGQVSRRRDAEAEAFL